MLSGSQGPHADEREEVAATLRLRAALVELAAANAQLQGVVEAMQCSRSWTLTAPLRKIGARLRGRRAAAHPAAAGESLPVALPAPAASPAHPRLLVDVTELAVSVHRSGVERVTRRVLVELLGMDTGYEVLPVRLSREGRYIEARAVADAVVGRAPTGEDGRAITPQPGDVFLGLDVCRPHAAVFERAIARVCEAEIPVVLVLHDVLPLDHPAWFPADVVADFEAWLRTVSRSATRVVTNTQATARRLAAALDSRRLSMPPAGCVVVGLGADAIPDLVVGVAPVARPDPGTRHVLMVGTVEPRKGHAQALGAFEAAWAGGMGHTLTIAGRQGWHVDVLAARLRTHPEAGRRLRWMEHADDFTLANLYRASDVVLMASHDEGFGLPIVEGRAAGCALLLRDIPVFREVAGDAAHYFEGDAPADLARALFATPQRTTSPDRAAMRWRETTAQLLEACRDSQ